MSRTGGDLSPQTPQWRQNPWQLTLPPVNLALLFVASHKNGSLAPGPQPFAPLASQSGQTLDAPSKPHRRTLSIAFS